jgi:hypothetical protein
VEPWRVRAEVDAVLSGGGGGEASRVTVRVVGVDALEVTASEVGAYTRPLFGLL